MQNSWYMSDVKEGKAITKTPVCIKHGAIEFHLRITCVNVFKEPLIFPLQEPFICAYEVSYPISFVFKTGLSGFQVFAVF